MSSIIKKVSIIVFSILLFVVVSAPSKVNAQSIDFSQYSITELLQLLESLQNQLSNLNNQSGSTSFNGLSYSFVSNSAEVVTNGESYTGSFAFTFDLTASSTDIFIDGGTHVVANGEPTTKRTNIFEVSSPEKTYSNLIHGISILSGATYEDSAILIKDGETAHLRVDIDVVPQLSGYYKVDQVSIAYGTSTNPLNNILNVKGVSSNYLYIDGNSSGATTSSSVYFEMISPVGGEVWEKNTNHTIDWASKGEKELDDGMVAYLDKKSGKNFVEVGKIEKNEKGSIITSLGLEGKGFDYPAGKYYVRLVYTPTGDWVRSKNPITIKELNSTLKVKATLTDKDGVYKVNPETGNTFFQTKSPVVNFKWSSSANPDSCSIYYYDANGNWVALENQKSSGTIALEVSKEGEYVSIFDPNETASSIQVNCDKTTNKGETFWGRDSVFIDVTDQESPIGKEPQLTGISRNYVMAGDRVLIGGRNILPTGVNTIELKRKEDGATYSYKNVRSKKGSAFKIYFTIPKQLIDRRDIEPGETISVDTTPGEYELTLKNIYGVSNSLNITVYEKNLYSDPPNTTDDSDNNDDISDDSGDTKIYPVVESVQAPNGENGVIYAGSISTIRGLNLDQGSRVFLMSGNKKYEFEPAGATGGSIKVAGFIRNYLEDGRYNLYVDREGVISNYLQVYYLNSDQKVSPTASLTINGEKEYTIHTGDKGPIFAWSSTNGNKFQTKLYINAGRLCPGISNGQVSTVVGTKAKGSRNVATASPDWRAPKNRENCDLTYTYTVTNTQTGETASDSVVLHYRAKETSSLDFKLFNQASVFSAMHQIFSVIGDKLK